MTNKIIGILITILLVHAYSGYAQKPDIKGQADAWIIANPFDVLGSQAGLRYIPEVTGEKIFKDTTQLDAEISLKTFISGTFSDTVSPEYDGEFQPYRIWLRYSGKQFEIRGGLQKINFGPATMLRSLMWFDRIDPRDPLKITNGVYGILTRYYFLNNANLWLWGLYGNCDTKGLELVKSNKWRPEFGGRLQFPALKGELGITYHNREVDFRKDTSNVIRNLKLRNENKAGIDGRWDIDVGLWFEAVLIKQKIDKELYPWSKNITLGIDYTFGIGNGLTLVKEYFVADASQDPFEFDKNIQFSAFSARYPVGLFDQVSIMIYYDWTNDNWYRFINWGRQYDKVSINVIAYWNPDQFQMFNAPENALFGGGGFQFMFVYNH